MSAQQLCSSSNNLALALKRGKLAHTVHTTSTGKTSRTQRQKQKREFGFAYHWGWRGVCMYAERKGERASARTRERERSTNLRMFFLSNTHGS